MRRSSSSARTARRLDRLQRLLGFVGLRVDHVGAHAGLHGDHAHRVGDDIVKLLGDAQPLAAHGLASLGVAIPLQLRRTFLGSRETFTTRPHRLAGDPHDRERQTVRQQIGLVKVARRPGQPQDRKGRPEQQEGRDTNAPASVGGHRIERNDRCDRQPCFFVSQAAGCYCSSGRHHEDDEGIGAAPRQRAHPDDRQGVCPEVGLRIAGIVIDDAGDRQHEHRERECAVLHQDR